MAIVKFISSTCPMNNIFPYVMNRNKTEDGILVSGIHCTPESALDEFRFVKTNSARPTADNITTLSNLSAPMTSSHPRPRTKSVCALPNTFRAIRLSLPPIAIAIICTVTSS